MSDIFSNPKANATSQDLLKAKMLVKGSFKAEAANCARCGEAEKDMKERQLAGEKVPKKQCSHCHCSFFAVTDELLADLRSHQPHKKSEIDYKKELWKMKKSVQNWKKMKRKLR